MKAGNRDIKRLLGEIGAFIVIAFALLVFNYHMADQFAEDAASINLAGRQRMLTQRIAKTLLQLQYQSSAENRISLEREFRDAIRLFDQTLSALEQGGTVEGGNGEPVRLRRISDAQAVILISRATQVWQPMRDDIVPLVTVGVAIPSGTIARAMALMQEDDRRLLELMNQLTTRLENSRANMFLWFQVAGLLIAFATFLLIVDSLRRTAMAATQNSRRFESMATRDPLTGLFNRREFENALEREFASAQRRAGSMALLLLDLDGFKAVNDAMGHDAGDRVLCAVAGRLSECARANDMVARLGGDEFVLICPGISAKSDAAALSERLIEAINRPIEVEGWAARVGASIGIAFSNQRVEEGHELLRRADRAMYAAKQAGRNRYMFVADMSA